MGTKLNMSTSRHPHADGQTEKADQTLEEMLRAYVPPYHDDWDEHLIATELAYNDSGNASTGYAPLDLNYGRNPVTPRSMLYQPDTDRHSSESVETYVGWLRADLLRARHAMKAAHDRQAMQTPPDETQVSGSETKCGYLRPTAIYPQCWYTLSRKERISVVAKFRMGVHWLNIDAGRMHNCMPRSQRLCKCCDLRSRE
jgi:hypothetical protein